MYWLKLFVLVMAMAVTGQAMAAPSYVQPVPMSQLFPVDIVGGVKPGPVRIPVITWGGDIATVLANGNAKTTQKGSIFERGGLNITLFREDDFTKQVRAYLSGETPYLRGTMGMINMAAEVASRDPRTEPVLIYQLTWSTNGDVLVVRSDVVKTPKDLCGKTIVLQAYGPHVDYVNRVLADVGPNCKATFRWTKDLTDSKQDPATAFREDKSVHAAMVIMPDAEDLTGGRDKIGTGAEKSVKGAKILLTTRSATRVIADVYVVRRDYFEAHRAEVQKFTHGLLLAEEALTNLVRQKDKQKAAYGAMLKGAAAILLDKPDTAAIEGMYGDCEYVGYKGNVEFFGNPRNLRNSNRLTEEIQASFIALGITSKKVPLQHARWDYSLLAAGLTNIAGVEAPKFDTKEVARVIDTRVKQGTLAEGELFSFEVYFQPNQNSFPIEQYTDAFKRAVELAATYGGAIISVEGHSDPLHYLQRKSKGATERELTEVAQAAKNLSLTRANMVRQGAVGYAKGRNIPLDQSQFATIGHGIMRPRNGMCGSDPCAPKTESEWRNNMRVEFRIIRVEAEAPVFTPISR